MERVIAKRYAKALISLVSKKTEYQQVNQDMGLLAEAYKSNLDFQHFIKEPKFPLGAKVSGLGNLCQAMGVGTLTEKFVRYLVTKHRFILIGDIAEAYDRQALEKLGQGRAKVTSAVKLQAAQTKALAAQLSAYTHKDITIKVEVDPSLLGGAITQIGSLVLDGSVKSQLNQICKTISKGN